MTQSTTITSAAASTATTFETNSRKLEQFLYMHDISHVSWHKDEDNMTVWVYPDTEEVREVVSEYRRIVARRKEREEAKEKISWAQRFPVQSARM